MYVCFYMQLLLEARKALWSSEPGVTGYCGALDIGFRDKILSSARAVFDPNHWAISLALRSLLFWNWFSHSPGWPLICYIAEDDLVLLIYCLPLKECITVLGKRGTLKKITFTYLFTYWLCAWGWRAFSIVNLSPVIGLWMSG